MTLTNRSKTGTLILGHYRSGTHYLKDVILDQNPDILEFDEIDSIDQLENITKISQYKICIVNNIKLKFHLLGRKDILTKWHVVNLTRVDKVSHFRSWWFWEKNTLQDRINNTGKFKHHDTDAAAYKNALGDPVTYDINFVMVWLQEQFINYHLSSDTWIDYSDLPSICTQRVAWKPNQYDTIKLSDIFENHKEIEDLLVSFQISSGNQNSDV